MKPKSDPNREGNAPNQANCISKMKSDKEMQREGAHHHSGAHSYVAPHVRVLGRKSFSEVQPASQQRVEEMADIRRAWQKRMIFLILSDARGFQLWRRGTAFHCVIQNSHNARRDLTLVFITTADGERCVADRRVSVYAPGRLSILVPVFRC